MMDRELAKNMEGILRELIINNSNIECDEDDCFLNGVDEVSTFEDKHFITSDRGVVIDFENGSCCVITIQAYDRRC